MKGMLPATVAACLFLCAASVAGAPAGETLPELARKLRDENETTRWRAAVKLSRMGTRAVPVLTEALGDRDFRVRREAVTALRQIGAEAKMALPALVKALRDKDGEVRERAAETLGFLGPAAAPAVPELIRSVKLGGSGAVWALGAIGPQAKAAIPALTARLDDNEPTRAAAARALGGIGVSDNRAAVKLAQMVKDDGCEIARIDAACALGAFGPKARVALPLLVAKLNDQKDPAGATYAAYAVKKIDPRNKLAAPVLVTALNRERSAIRRSLFLGLLGDIGPDAAEAIPALTGLLSDGELRQEVEETLRKIHRKRKKQGIPEH